MTRALTKDEIELLLQSLDYTRRAMEQHGYPTPDLRRQRLDEAETIRGKLLDQKRELRGR